MNLLSRVAAGDPAAIRECTSRFGGLVWSLARRASVSQEDAEDATQEIFLDLWRSAARYDARVGSEVTFVAMIARRRLIDRRRSRQRAPRAVPLVDEAASAGAPSAELGAEAALAARALEQLRPEQRQVLLLSACHGLSHEEISSSTGMPLGTVKAHARRGLLRVREVLGEGAPRAAAPAVMGGVS